MAMMMEEKSPESILDVGCGGGDFAAFLAQKFPHVKIIGMDIDAGAIRYAQNKWKVPNLSFVHGYADDLPDTSFDIVTSTLVCHHLNDDELIAFTQNAHRIAKKMTLFNDLHRHRLAYLLFAAISPLLFPSRLIWHDGLLSIKRSFRKEDWERLLPSAKITRHWPFRWIVRIDK